MPETRDDSPSLSNFWKDVGPDSSELLKVSGLFQIRLLHKLGRNFGKLFQGSPTTFQRLPYYLVLQLCQPIYATSLLRTWNSPYCLRISLRPSETFREAVGLLLSREELDGRSCWISASRILFSIRRLVMLVPSLACWVFCHSE